MTAYTLNFWSKSCGSSQIRRVYVNTADRSTLGYFEERIGTAERGAGSYYDAHRLAKGDTVVETGRAYATTVPAEAAAAIYAALGVPAQYQGTIASDDFTRFNALVSHARGVTTIPYHPARSPAGRAERKRIAEHRSFTIEL